MGIPLVLPIEVGIDKSVMVFIRVKPEYQKDYNGEKSLIDTIPYSDYQFIHQALLEPDFDTEYRKLMISEIQLIKPKCAQ